MSSGGNSQPKAASAAPWDAQQPFLKDLMGNAAQQYNAQSGNMGNLPSQVVDPNQNIQQAWQGSLDYANTQGKNISNQATQGFGNLLNSMDVANSPLVQSQIAQANRQVSNDFNYNVMPGIANDAAAAGQVGSSRQGVAQGFAAKAANEAMGNNATNIMANAYQIGSQNAQNALAQSPMVYNMGNMGNMLQGQVGQDQASWAQAKLGDQFNQWQYQQQRPWDLLSMYQGAVTGNYGGTNTQSK